MHAEHEGGAVVCAVICPFANIGLFVRNPEHPHPLWKFPGGRIEEGESVEDALRRETEEETGFAIGDEHMFIPAGSEEASGRHGSYMKHHFIAITTDPRDLWELDKQIRKEDDTETIEVAVFDLDFVANKSDFAWQHQQLLAQAREEARAAQA